MTIHTARLGVREFRVIRPAGAPLRASLRFGGDNHMVFASSGAAMRIAAFWEIAARSPHTLVHVPLRGDGTAPQGWHEIVTAGSGLDLLLTPRQMQFAGHEWKRLRSRLGRGRSATFALPPGAIDSEDKRAFTKLWDRESTRKLDLAVHAETLVVTGDRTTLRYGRDLFTHVGRESLRARGSDPLSYTSNEIHESDVVLRRHESGIYLWIPRDQRWV